VQICSEVPEHGCKLAARYVSHGILTVGG
jgi:hypothetical protein